jgi:hypothetical protein
MDQWRDRRAGLGGAAVPGRLAHRTREIWRLRFRSRWQELRPIAVIAVAITVVTLGAIGYSELYPEFTVVDAFYNSVQLLGFGGAATTPIPWELEVARILGPALTGYAAARGVMALAREQVTLLMFRLFLRDHVVVAGLSDTGFALTVRLYEAGARLVVIENDATRPAVKGCRERGIAVLIGDATDSRLLEKARVGQARLLVAAAGEDGVNANVAAKAASLVQGRTRGSLTALIRVDDPTLHAALEGWILHGDWGSAFRLETFNVKSTAARILAEQHPPFPAGRPARSVIMGDGHLVEAIAINAVREWLARESEERATIVIAGPSATVLRAELTEQVDLEAMNLDVQALDLSIGRAPAVMPEHILDAGSIYTAFEDEASNLALAISLRAAMGASSTPIVAIVREEDSGVSAVLGSDRSDASIVPFGILTRTLTPDLVFSGRTELLARAMHEGYRRARQTVGESEDQNESLAPWDRLPESLKESNRAFAAGIGAKLKRAGFIAAPAIAPTHNGADWLSAELLEDFAEAEHERWARDLERQGWRHGAVKDSEAKTHPSLVPYAELSEEEREKDRDAVREVPAILGAAGFELRRIA